jgi:hypothetical protein
LLGQSLRELKAGQILLERSFHEGEEGVAQKLQEVTRDPLSSSL